MVDTPTTRNRFRKQEPGTNNNTWGTKLNEVIDCVDQVVDGVGSIDLGGLTTYTLTTSDYSISDQAKNRVLLFSNAAPAGTNAILPSVQHQYTAKNTSGMIVTAKTAAGTGVAIPPGRQTDIFCDGTNVLGGSATWLLNYPSTLTFQGDIVVKETLEQAIANASFPASAGSILISVSDTTAGYASGKFTAGTGIVWTVTSPGGNERLEASVNTVDIPEFLAITGTETATIANVSTPMTSKRTYRFTGTGPAVLPTMGPSDFVDVIMAQPAGTTGTVGRNGQTIDGASEDDTWRGDDSPVPVIRYSYAAGGAVRSELIGSAPL